jgi:DNA-binding MarR family transcriptional regulator
MTQSENTARAPAAGVSTRAASETDYSPANRDAPLVRLIDELVRLTGRLRTIFSSEEITESMSGMEATVLAAVVEASLPPTVPQIGRSLGHARQVIQRAANELVAAGLIRQEPNPHHKRAPVLLATADGVRIKRETEMRAAEATAQLAQRLGVDRCSHLATELHAMRGEIEAYFRSGRTKS